MNAKSLQTVPLEQRLPTFPPNRDSGTRAARSFFLNEAESSCALSVVVLIAIGGVAYTDYRVDAHLNLGYLYLLPLALSSVIHPLRVSVVFTILCTILHDLFGPYENGGWETVARNVFLFAGLSTVVLGLNRLSKHRIQLNEIVRIQRDDLKNEMELAATVQQRLLPQTLPTLNGIGLAGCMYPARAVGGDYYDFFSLPDETLAIAIADVAGKGASAALLMSVVSTAVHLTARSSPAEVCGQLNQILCDVTEQWRFVSLVFAKLTLPDYRLHYVNAGHPPPIVYRPSTGERFWLDSGGPVLGVIREAEFSAGFLDMKRGDVLLMYTDGSTEATNGQGAEFSRAVLADNFVTGIDSDPQTLLDRIHGAVVRFHGSDVLEDDLTLVVMKID